MNRQKTPTILGAALAVCAIYSSYCYPADLQYQIRNGDQVRVTVYGHKDLSGVFEVDNAGNIKLPLIEDVKATGLNRNGLIGAIVDKLKPDYLLNPKVSVEIIKYRPFYILGEVKQPGSYPYVSGMTLNNAVALAGGYTYRARIKGVTVARASDSKKKKQKATRKTKIYPGDVIEVPERYF